MELRVLRYFLEVAREENITRAAERLHLTQPTLSRQLLDLEEALGKTLFLRGKRKLTLTEEGVFLRKRAQEIVELVEKTEAALRDPAESVCGDVHIAGGETDAMRLIARTAKRLKEACPRISFHLFSGNAEDVSERLDRGLADFGVFIRPANVAKYECLPLPFTDVWGVLMRKDSPLAARKSIRPEDLAGLPLICSRQTMAASELAGWMGDGRPHIVATYNLLYNAALMVEEGVGYALCLDRIADTSDASPLCFRPLEPGMEVGLYVAWKKQQVFSRAAARFLEFLRRDLTGRRPPASL